MEQKKQIGGKRRGAGRKPVLSKKKQYSLYIEGAKIMKFGGEEVFKKTVTEFIDNFGNDEPKPEINYTAVSPAAYDGKRLDKITHDEPAMFQEPKSTITGLPPKLSAYDGFSAELNKASTIAEVQEIMKRAKGEVMFPREMLLLDNQAKEVSKDMFTD